MTRLGLTVCVHGSRLNLQIDAEARTYRVTAGQPVFLWHNERRVTILVGSPITVCNQKKISRPEPTQPANRSPVRALASESDPNFCAGSFSGLRR